MTYYFLKYSYTYFNTMSPNLHFYLHPSADAPTRFLFTPFVFWIRSVFAFLVFSLELWQGFLTSRWFKENKWRKFLAQLCNRVWVLDWNNWKNFLFFFICLVNFNFVQTSEFLCAASKDLYCLWLKHAMLIGPI